ncbi:MFS transporter [Rhodococcus sp. H29-C3]|uniref:MFS transporter n=1 Tax=Rhodococcus sp. H29-C3 TaxID=3046307 RepID=UPI0024B8F3E8|nr:MFS transporter [Rhodococcus sp. H29-C3]MDJ0363058.1 MFS transporter [Rhodococcus sp. H29-C3]
MAVGIASLIAFVLVEARTIHPLLPLRIVTDRNRGAAYLTAFLLGAGMFGMLLFITYYLQVNLGYEPLMAGLAFLPFSAGIIGTASLASSLLPRFGPKPLMAFGMATATIGLAWMITLDSSSTYLGSVLPSELMMGIGLGLVFVPMSTVALSGIEPHDAGVASAMLNTSQQIGGTLGLALLNTLYAAALNRHVTASPGLPREQAVLEGTFAGYTVAFTVGAALFAGALVVIIAMLRADRQRT